MPALRTSNDVASINARMIRVEVLSAALGYYVQGRLSDHCRDQRHPGTLHQQIAAPWLSPKAGKFGIVDKHAGRIRCIGTVLEIRLPAVEQQGTSISIEENRRERVVGVVFD